MAAPKHDWPELRRKYVEDDPDRPRYPTQKALAEAEGVPHQSLRRRAAAEGWDHQRLLFRQRVEDQRRRERIDHLGVTAASLDAKALKAAEVGLDLVRVGLNAMGKVATRTQQTPDGTQVDSLQLDRLGRAALTWHRIAHLAMGDDPGGNGVASGVALGTAAAAAGLDLAALPVDDLRALRAIVRKAMGGVHGDGTDPGDDRRGAGPAGG